VISGKVAVGGLRSGIEPFIEQLAAPIATPGGGSAAAASGAMAAGLANMVASMSRGKKAYLQHEARLSEAIARLGQLREELKSAIDADAESYNLVMKAYRAAKESSDGEGAINSALKQATSVPLGVAERAVEVAQIAENLKPLTNPNMKSDLTTAIALATAALTGAHGKCRDQSGIAEGRGFCEANQKPGRCAKGIAQGLMRFSSLPPPLIFPCKPRFLARSNDEPRYAL